MLTRHQSCYPHLQILTKRVVKAVDSRLVLRVRHAQRPLKRKYAVNFPSRLGRAGPGRSSELHPSIERA